MLLLAGAMLCATSAAAAPPAYAPLVLPKVDPAKVQVPDLTFTPTADDQQGYEKYFYFHRAETDFATAYADIRECDHYARGFAASAAGDAASQAMMNQMVAQYGMAGAVGGAIGSAMADAIFGSAERRKMRRTNLRRCMGFKDYKAYGLPKSLWTQFNFEEGLSPPPEEERERKLEIQAKIASGPAPTVGEIGQ